MSDEKPQLIWSSSFEQNIFSNIGLNDFEKFWNVEKAKSGIEYKHIRQHIEKRGGMITRQMTCLKHNDICYYLKRFQGKSYQNAIHEYEALNVISQFGLNAAKLLAHSFDEKNKRAILLFKNLMGSHSLKKLMENTAPPDVLADFQLRKKDILKNLVSIIEKFQKSEYFYPDWLAKHIFIKIKSNDITLIDLERLRHIKQCPSYYRFRLARYFIRRREWKTLGKSLRTKFYTEKIFKKLLSE